MTSHAAHRFVATTSLFVLLCLAFNTAGIGTVHAIAPLRLVVYGGTGNIGQRVVHEALRRGYTVTVVVRDPSVMPEKPPQLSVVKGDVLDPRDVGRRIRGSDVVVSAVSFRKPTGDPAAFTQAGRSLVTAVRSLGARAPYLIVVGGAGSLEQPAGRRIEPPAAWKDEIKGQNDSLAYYRTISDVRWTYFSPAAMITPGARTGNFRLGGDQMIMDDQGNSRISMEDYAVALLDEAEKPAHVRQRFTIGY